MLSEKTNRHIQKLLANQTSYLPNPAVQNALKTIKLVCFVGASSMGKTTVMDMLVALDPMHFGKTRNFTTRPSRPDDDPSRYYYFEHTESGLAPIFERIKTHELLQYNIDPFSYYIYGSEIEGYTHDYNLGDIWSTSIAGFRQLGFGELYVCSVVTEAAEWLARFDQRFPAGNPLRSARLKEAVVSLEWSLAQTNPDHRLIINRNKMASNAAESVRRFIDGQVEDQAEAKQLALDCLALAKKQNNAQT